LTLFAFNPLQSDWPPIRVSPVATSGDGPAARLVAFHANLLSALYLHNPAVMNHDFHRTIFDAGDCPQDALPDIAGNPFASLAWQKKIFFRLGNFYISRHFISRDQGDTTASYQRVLIFETNNISFVYLFFAYARGRLIKAGFHVNRVAAIEASLRPLSAISQVLSKPHPIWENPLLRDG
jgi:hypothetical protein